MTDFKPYADDSSVVTVGELAIENGTDAIAIHGSVDLRRDKAGLQAARRLRDELTIIVQALEDQNDLPDEVAAPERSTRTFDNPFGGGAE